jgi:hypothetical protein
VEASRAERGSYIQPTRLSVAELFGMASAGVLLLSLFLPWFSTSDTNRQSEIDGLRGDLTAWEVFNILDWLLVAACAAPFILAWIIARGHKLSWAPGEVTAIVGITATVLILCNGVILGKPGNSVEVSLAIGYLVGLLGALGIVAAGFLRQSRGQKKKPPGEL